MAIESVWVQTPALGFNATVDIDGEALDPDNMPVKLSGEFKSYENTEQILAEFHIHSERTQASDSHKLWFNNKRREYKFTMDSRTSSQFHAVS
jgi:hypothetical protein